MLKPHRRYRPYRRVFKDYFTSFTWRVKKKELFSNVRTYCMFLGYPRSGHSLIGSLMDAHPNIIIAHELDALLYVRFHFSKNKIFNLILKNSKDFSKKGREWTGYSYKVKNQHQGKSSDLQIIGDKEGNMSIRDLRTKPMLLNTLRKRLNMQIKYIHVYRNPYDTITTMARVRKTNYKLRKADSYSINDVINTYFSSVETVSNLRKELKDEILNIKQESFIENPKKQLKRICAFLGVSVTEDYLDDCANIVFKKPNKSRYGFKWTPELIKIVKDKSSKYSFLKDYDFND